MDINASIVDQRVAGIAEKYADWLPEGSRKDPGRQTSAAFVLLCLSTYLDISMEEASELITDGGGDAGVDGLHVGEIEDGEFLVTIFQCKYKRDLGGESNFPENDVRKVAGTVQVLFDPDLKVSLNKKIEPDIEEIRSFIRDGFIPNVRVVLCNNGERWAEEAEQWLQDRSLDDRVEFIHFNHDAIVGILQSSKKVDTVLTLNGQAIVEDMNYMRVILGRISVYEIQRLFNEHGDRLLERNVRRYLGLHINRVNKDIHDTLLDPEKSDNFYFYNNGITIVCDKFEYNALQGANYRVQIKNMQIINGGQTCKTIQETLNKFLPHVMEIPAYVMVRIYQLAETQDDFVHEITYATNSQNPVDFRDLRSNDEKQKQLEMGMKELGYTYKRKREEGAIGPEVITSATVAESVLAVWREKPHQSKTRRREHFGKLYDYIFSSLNAAQAVLAVLIFRDVENKRKRLEPFVADPFLPYASHYLSMLVGRKLLTAANVRLEDISHRNFDDILQVLKGHQDEYHEEAMYQVNQALYECYGGRSISFQQLSATFRRGDLLEILNSDSSGNGG